MRLLLGALNWSSVEVLPSRSSPTVTSFHYSERAQAGWLAAAQAPWSRNNRRMRAAPRGKSPCPTSGGCGRISRRKPSLGSVLNWDRSVGVPGARRAAKRNRGCGCSRGKRNSLIGCFRRLSRICAALPRRLLKEIRNPSEATLCPAPAAAASRWYSPLAQLLEPRGANPSWRRTEAQSSPYPSWSCTSRRAPLSARHASRSWWWTRPRWWERRSSCVKTQVILWVKSMWQNTHPAQYLLLPSRPKATVNIHILNEVGWATVSWKLNKADKFHDGGAATCSLLVACHVMRSSICQFTAFFTLSCSL